VAKNSATVQNAKDKRKDSKEALLSSLYNFSETFDFY
jgi:hypothetical protein